ncbi:MAG: TRAP transporter small permease [Comamonas sp.]
MNRLLDLYSKALDALTAALLLVMVVLVFGNVVLRYGFNSGWTVSEEVSRWAFIWVVFLGAVVGMHHRGHLGTDMLISRLPRRGQQICYALSQLLMMLASYLVMTGSWQQTLINWDVSAPTTGWSMAAVYLSGVVFAASTLVILAFNLYRLFTGQLARQELTGIQESEEAVPSIHAKL